MQPVSSEAATPRKATGPVTPEGKAASSLNAFQHGIYSKYICFRTEEERDDCDEILAGFVDSWNPANESERYCVSAMARAAFWKLRLQAADEAEWLDNANNGTPLLDTPGYAQFARRYRQVKSDYNQALAELKHHQRERRRRLAEQAKLVKEQARLARKNKQEAIPAPSVPSPTTEFVPATSETPDTPQHPPGQNL